MIKVLIYFMQYNRTAEREAQLIRPLPVLQKTVDYLLNLVNQPYDDKFLNTYNFLWDRMRAVRMDLRMQHIFNSDAITMHEQMVFLSDPSIVFFSKTILASYSSFSV